MSRRVTATHADWLTLVEPIGPFLTLPVARRVWGSGLDRVPAGLRSELRDRVEALGTDEVARRGFVDWALRHLLSYGRTVREGQAVPATCTVTLPEHGVLLHPDFAVVEPEDETKARLLVTLWPARTDLAAHLPDDRWTASPIDRMATLCRQVGVELGLVSDGDRFALVWAPSTGPIGRATWVMSVCAEPREASLLDSFVSVLGAKRLFSVGDRDKLEALLAESASAQAEVTAQLGVQVRRAVEMLIAAFSFANAEQRRAGRPEPMAGLDPGHVYEAACTVMMRLVFLLYAEERHLLPLGDELYDRSYAASTLRQELRDIADSIGNEETLEHSWTAWPRLLATFRAVYAGLGHDELRLPAYGGRLFDPDRFSFLEGRKGGEGWRDTPSDPIAVDDRTVLAALTALQVLEMRQGGVTEARRLSFRSLDVEQIGHVYEGLLDHGTRRIENVGLGLVGRPGEEPEVDLDDLEERAQRGDDNLLTWLGELTGKSQRELTAALTSEPDEQRRRSLLAACHNDGALFERVERYGNLLRNDIRELPMVMHPGDIYVTEVSHRRDTGTEYTTKELADEVAHYALEPLVYCPGPAEGAAPEEWKLKAARDILALRVCDPAVGSGAIITAACRYLADRVVEAWQVEGAGPQELPTSAGDDVADVVIAARRAVADRCLYGVDRDPMAVEMAKLSLWLVTMAKDRPFSFLDHAFRSGDSLLGVTSFDQVSHFHIDPSAAQRPLNFAGDLEPMIKEALDLRRRLEDIPVLAIRDAEEKARLLAQANSAMRTVEVLADLVIGAALSTVGTRNDINYRLAAAAIDVRAVLNPSADGRGSLIDDLESRAAAWLNEHRPNDVPLRKPLHWPLAFPEVFQEDGRFAALIANPPFQGGTKISAAAGTDYKHYLATYIAGRSTDRADLAAFFFLQGTRLSNGFGFLATNTISQGDTREVGLAWLVEHGWVVTRAVKSIPWPGSATVQISKVWIHRAPWQGHVTLDEQPVANITSYLEPSSRVAGDAFRLKENDGRCFLGDQLNTMGFVLTTDEAKDLLARSSKNTRVVRPYLSGEDLNSRYTLDASRWVICFFDWPLEKAIEYDDVLGLAEQRARPDIESKVKSYPRWPQRWWQYWMYKSSLHELYERLGRVLVMAKVSRTAVPVFVSTDFIYSDKVIVFGYDDDFHAGVLTSSVHYHWSLKYTHTMRTDLSYSPTDVFLTFPQPPEHASVGQRFQMLDAAREQWMREHKEGLTRLYSKVHDPDVADAGVETMRAHYEALDIAVAEAYGWGDLDLDHGFSQTAQGIRWTIGPEARAEVLDRLLEENHRRYAAEQSESHGARKPGRPRTARATAAPVGQGTIDWATGANQ